MDCRIRLIEDRVLHTEDPSNEPKEWGDLEGQSGLFVIAVERSRNLVDLNTILLENCKLIRLERNFRWLRWLVRLDLIVSHSLEALLENIGSLPSLQDLNLPSAVDPPSVGDGATISLSKSKKCLKELPEHPRVLAGDNILSKEDPLQYGLVLLSRSDKGIHPKSQYEHLYIEGFPASRGTLVIDNLLRGKSCVLRDNFKELVTLKDLWLHKSPEVLLSYNPQSNKRPQPTTAISICGLPKLEGKHKWLNTFAFSMYGWDNILRLEKLQVGPVYLLKEVPLQRIKYTVFLVYHGPDVTEKFIHNLFESLRAGGVQVLNIDLNKWEIEGGKCLDLEQGWERTDIHIPIVSRNYEGSFSRHLGELLRMCRSISLIRPLFYNVEPTDVLDIKTVYKSVFSSGATQDCSSSSEINEVSSSRNGRHQMSFLTGWSLADDGSLEQLVRRVVFDILQIVNDLPFHAVGLEEPMSDMMDILKMESDDSLTVGICGTGGIGKTTLAKAIFNSSCFRFQAASFVTDVKRHDICEIQEHILRDLGGRCISVKSVKHGKALVKANAGSLRALVILDDINSLRQLEAFSVDWLAPGSRVILTSRDDRLFSCGRTDGIYYINKLSDNYSIELFSWHAFLRKYPHDHYEGWTQRIVKACHGIPLLIEVVGAFLYGKKIDTDWESSTKDLEDTMDQDIQRRLEFSYRGLDLSEKEIFLDIACFFNGHENVETASRYWEAIGFRPRISLGNLVLKSLIWIDEQNKFIMHDYVQEMGRAIANESKLEERTRIWKPEEAMHVTSGNLDTASIRSISISEVEGSNIIVKDESFARMTNLNLLWMDALEVERGNQKILPNFRWLRWNSCPLKHLPSRWRLGHTVVLDLSSVARGPPTKLQSLWDRSSFSKKLGNLSVLRVKNAAYLQKLPDFSCLTSLSTLDLEKCYNLRKLPSSIGCLGALKSLNLTGCRNLVELPDSISKLFSLERLSLRHCFSLKEFPNAIEELIALVELDAGFSRVDKLPSLQRLSRLEKLILTGCWSIKSLPPRSGELVNLKELDIHSLGLVEDLPSLEKLSSLKKLVLNGCASLTGLPSSIGKLCCLEYLDMNGCSSIYRLPEEFGDLVRLEKLFMNNCFKLSMLPDSFGNLASLTTLEMKHNCNLMRLPSSFSRLHSLLCLDASDCNFFDGFPEKIGDLAALQVVNLENNFFRELPSTIHDLGFLRELNVSKCQCLERLPTLPKGLVKLDAGDCTQLKTINDMSHLERLKILILCNCENLTALPNLKSCVRLVVLNISRCRKVRSLAGAQGLSSLKTLYLSGSGVSAVGLSQWIKDMPYLQELSFYANKVPQWLECKKGDQYLRDENSTDILISPVNKTTKCGGVVLCFVLNFMYEFRSDEFLSRNCMKMSIRGDDGEEFWSTVFSNRQRVKGDQLYVCLYRVKDPLTMTLQNINYVQVMAKGTNIQIKECGMKLLYNGIGDLNLESFEEDLSSLLANYNDETVTDKVAARETDFPHQTMYEEDGDVYDYVYSTSEDEYGSNEDCNHIDKDVMRYPWAERPKNS